MLETLYAHDEPLTAEQVARRIGGEAGGDVASVYRNLETLERLGLVRHFHLGHSPGLYVRAGAGVSRVPRLRLVPGRARRRPRDAGRRARRDRARVRLGGPLHPRSRSWACAPTAGPRRTAARREGPAMSFEWLFGPVEDLDSWLTGYFDGAPLLVALGLAFVLGLRHASDPDHLVAVTSLVAADDGDTRAAGRLGAWWGLGHATVLLAIGVPLIVFQSSLPGWLEAGAEKAVGVVIILLALRVAVKWVRGDYRVQRHSHSPAASGDGHARRLRHLRARPGRAHPPQRAHARGRRLRSARCTASRAPAPWWCC